MYLKNASAMRNSIGPPSLGTRTTDSSIASCDLFLIPLTLRLEVL
jgi:hypothetical protein